MTDPYQYEYLEPGSIRVLKLMSVSPDIRLSFDVVSLDSTPHYNALSYRWVKSSPQTILLDGKPFQISSSLALCIEHLDAFVGTRIWIDAVCINQADLAEKSHQVQSMSRIYRQASSVLIWLGPSAEDSDSAMEGIDKYGEAALEGGIFDHGKQFFQRWPDVGDDPVQLRTKTKLLDLMRAATDAEAEGDGADWFFPRLAFAKLTHRDYFYRVWVKQEVTLARETVMICGRRTTTIDRFHAALMLYGLLRTWEIVEWRSGRLTRFPGPFTMDQLMAAGHPYDLLKTLDTSGAPGPLCAGRKTFWRDGISTLHSVLETSYVRTGFGGLASEKAVDRVFGILGIARDAEELGVVADYSKTAAEVYEMTARALVRQGHVDVLKWCRSRGGRRPSWVPNWEARIESSWSEDSGTQVFSAARGSAQPGEDSGDAAATPGALCLRGAVIDTISKVGTIWVADPNLSFDQAACRSVFSDITAYLEESRYSVRERCDATWRIPIGDKELPLNSPYFVRATARSEEQYSILAVSPLESDAMEKTYSYQTVMGYTPNARPILSKEGYVGLGPSEAEPGDIVVLLWGGTTPYVLRPTASAGGGFHLVGEAFVYGIMDGELMDQELAETTFELW